MVKCKKGQTRVRSYTRCDGVRVKARCTVLKKSKKSSKKKSKKQGSRKGKYCRCSRR